jgi:homoserine O-acetyltransferase
MEVTATHSVELLGGGELLRLEGGRTLSQLTVAYETYGTLNAARDNAVLVCHALTGSAHAAGHLEGHPGGAAGWWDPMIGSGKAFDTDRFFVVCPNILGSCYGTTGPVSTDPATGRPYGPSFPPVTVRDMVRVQHALLRRLGVRSLRTVTGGSLGGMQALEWAIMYPDMVRSLIPIATAASHSPWCIGLNEIARQAIMLDPAWHGGEYPPGAGPHAGLSLARQIAMISYRSDRSFNLRFARDRQQGNLPEVRCDPDNLFQVESYLHYQGMKLVARFDANTYIAITRAMDWHDIGYGRGTLEDVLSSVRSPALCVGITSDVLYPVHEQRALADGLPRGMYREIDSLHGHDAFLIEFEQLTAHVRAFLKTHGLDG